MPKAKKTSFVDEVEKGKKVLEDFPLEKMPLKSLGDYFRYNKKCRKLNKELGVCRHRVKQCPVHMHPHQKIVFTHKNNANCPVPVLLVNEMIDFHQKLTPGETYDLPLMIIDHLASRCTDIWKVLRSPDGKVNTVKSGTSPRFAVRSLFRE